MINITICTLLSILAWQDFKARRVWVILFPALAVCFVLLSLETRSVVTVLIDSCLNGLIIAGQLIFLTLYFSWKKKRFVNIIDKAIGTGDILFFLLLCIAFPPIQFVFFLVAGLTAAIICYLGYSLIAKKNMRFIPLAGILSVILIIYISSNILLQPILSNHDFVSKIISFKI